MARLIALVLGGANTLASDLAAAREMIGPFGDTPLIIGCNHAGRDHAGPVDHWVSMHPDLFPKWVAERNAKGLPPAGQLWGARHRSHGIDDVKPLESWGGSSGMLAIQLGLQFGCTHILLCGVPLHKDFAHYDDAKPWQDAHRYRAVWARSLHRMEGRVRSFGGWTATLLGVPDAKWIGR